MEKNVITAEAHELVRAIPAPTSHKHRKGMEPWMVETLDHKLVWDCFTSELQARELEVELNELPLDARLKRIRELRVTMTATG